MTPEKGPFAGDDPLWYKDAIIYQAHIKALFDSNGDGIGDFRGLIQKLDHLESLGVTAIWLLPFYPSPQRDDGYDIADYFSINPDYGTLADFRRFLREAHRRGLRVITELVINHTSDQHPWFQRARRAKPGSVWRDFYVWSDTPDKYPETRIIFQDFEPSNWSWDSLANAYYWHRFYAHQPDLNFDNPRVRKEVLRALDFWLRMGVDGLRLDAVPYLYEREGTNCENLPETHDFLKTLRRHVDERFANRMLLAEANQWPEDAVSYFGDGDECHTAFHFPVMPRLFMALRMEDRFPVIDILEQTPAIPDICQWVMFLRNHDELTLEMVTDEERDYMYRVYAQDPRAKINLGIRRRLAPLLNNDRKKIELMNILLLSLSGTPVIYYGDEIGMGDNHFLGDRNGVRTPMHWSMDRNAGFSTATPQRLYLPVIIDPEYHYQALNVENQERNLSSLLWWMRRVIAMRKQFRAFGRGTLEFIASDNPKVLSFVRTYEGESLLVLANLSRFAQVVELELERFSGCVPMEVFSQNAFPSVEEKPYVLTLGPHGYFWLSLHPQTEAPAAGPPESPREITFRKDWRTVLANDHPFIRRILPRYLPTCRWFGGKGRSIQGLRIVETIHLAMETAGGLLLIVEVSYRDGTPESYLLPLAYASGAKMEAILQEFPQSVIATMRGREETGILFDALWEGEFRKALLALFKRKKSLRAESGNLLSTPGKIFRARRKQLKEPIRSRVLKAEQSNSSILYQETFILKLFRRLEAGINPEIEVSRFLTEKAGYQQVPNFAGSLELRRDTGEPVPVAVLQEFVPNHGDAWTLMLETATNFFERILARRTELEKPPSPPSSLFEAGYETIPPLLHDLIGGIALDRACLLGRRTGELHRALAAPRDNPVFAPEPFSTLYQRSLYQSMREQLRRNLQALRANLSRLPEPLREEAADILAAEKKLSEKVLGITRRKLSGLKIRVHGDYHLGQVLFTGKDFVIIDFEGEPTRALSERRLKRSALRDVAGMLRSFHYAAHGPLLLPSSIRSEDTTVLEPWAGLWYAYMGGAFLQAYRETVAGLPFVPDDEEGFILLLELLLLEKAVYELHYELNNRPDWLGIPMKGIRHIMEGFD